jgi:uncharacterized membrane protein
MFRKQVAVLLSVFLFIGNALARPEVRYRITPLPGLEIVDLNDKGEVLLQRFDGERQRAYLWRAGELIELTDRIDPNSTQVRPAGLNDKGAIVGQIGVSGFLLLKDSVLPIDLGTRVVDPIDINDRGQILGTTDFPEHPGEENFLLKGTKVTVLDPLPGGFGTFAIALNDRGAITGESLATDSVRAVIWERDSVMEIITPRPAFTAFGIDINNRNQVVGGFDGRDGSHEYFFWSDGDMTLLESVSADRPFPVAVSINDCGDMVGTSLAAATPPAEWTATIWRNTVPLDLNSLVSDADPSKPFVKLIEAFRINNTGQIVALGIDSRKQEQSPYLLTPLHARGHKGISKCHR